MNRLRVSLPGTVCLVVLMGSIGTTHETLQAAGRPLPSTQLTNGAAMRRVFTEVVTDANRWTVRVLSNDSEVAFGVVVQADGYILTKGSRLTGRLECQLPGNRTLPAEYVGYHPDHDLALLKVDATGLPVVQWQAETDPAVGRWVVTPDQQGAPRAVGVLSVSRRLIPRVKIRGVLGVGLTGSMESAMVLKVYPKSGAELAGLRPDDVIKRVNELNIDSRVSLVQKIAEHRPGERLMLLVHRDGKDRNIEVTLGHPFGDFLSRIAIQNQMGGDLSLRRSGFPVVLQHDSVLKPEECGGPLVDLSGAAIGINIARAGRTESYAIPDDIVRPVIDELLSGQYPPPQVKLAGYTVSPSSRDSSPSGGE